MKATLRLRVIPNAKRNEVVGEYGEAIKIKIAAPALDGKANAAVCEFLAQKLGISVRAIELIIGEKSRDKVVTVEGMELAMLREKLGRDQ